MKEKGARRKEIHVGLDIGSRLIKALELSSEDNKWRMTKLHFVEIPAQTRLADSLKRLFESFQCSVKDVNISLSAPSAIVRFINMPKMKPDDLKNSLKFEAEKYIPFNINEVNVDAFILDNVELEKNQMKVLLAAAKKDIINSRLEALKELGFSVSVIDIDSFACFNAFSCAFQEREDSKNTALLNMGYSQTNVIISQGNTPFFTRDVQIGGKDIAKTISSALEIPEDEAHGLIFEPKEKRDDVREASKAALASLIEELSLSFGYYENQFGNSVNEIYVSGGLTRLNGMIEYLEENLGVKPVAWNPLIKFEKAPDIDAALIERVGPQFAVCAGLALRR